MHNYLYQNNLISIFEAVASRFILVTGYILAYAPKQGSRSQAREPLHEPWSLEQEVKYEEH